MTRSAPKPLLLILSLCTAPAAAQSTRTAQDTATAYGARLTTPGDPAKPLNQRRINNRIENRINNRLSMRIERYRVGAAADPLAAARQDQKTATSAYQTASDASREATASKADDRQQQREQQQQQADPTDTDPR
ncbi:hypothetical protein [uncultured Sphingomonas sp.]|uniref:hypothetical protein n=1 Tax=uncultured Sphingomonas sp. TaxID=158754 RepID=UPI0025EF8475|nr:hypothetical protein [uncultured Sphingomonas sp.]